MTEPKASSVHNYYIVPFRTGVQPDVLYCSMGQPSPKPLTSQSFSTCQQTVFAFLLWLPLIVCVVQTNVRMLFSQFFALKYQWKSLCLHVADFPARFSSSLSPQRRCFCSTNSHKRQWDEEFQLFPFTAINLFSISGMDLFHHPQG